MENRIAELLNELGMRPATFAEKIGVPSSTIYSIVNGKQKFEKIGIGTFIKIARGLGMTVRALLRHIRNRSCVVRDYGDISADNAGRKTIYERECKNRPRGLPDGRSKKWWGKQRAG